METYLSFCAGGSQYVILVKDVVYIADSSSLNLRTIPSTETIPSIVFEFADKPVPLIRLSDAFGQISRAQESRELIKLLDQRRQDHIDWLDALEQSLIDDTPFAKTTDPHQCAFGLWYDKYEANDEDLNEILKQFDAPHKTIHKLGEKLLSQARQSEENRKNALAELKEHRQSTMKMLLKLFRQANSRLMDMDKQVTLIVAHEDDRSIGIEVDQVGEVIDFHQSEFIENSLEQSLDSHCFKGFFQNKDGLFIYFESSLLGKFVASTQRVEVVSSTP